MKKLKLLVIFLIMFGCNKHKTVLICGDHVCINKAEANQYFEDNLSLEVKIVDKKQSKTVDLVELNLKSNSVSKKEIKVSNKKKTNNELKILSKAEVKEKKIQLRKREKINTKIKIEKKRNQQAKLNKTKSSKMSKKDILKSKKVTNKSTTEIVDICTILPKCNIDEISKYLIKQGKEKGFPDITKRE